MPKKKGLKKKVVKELKKILGKAGESLKGLEGLQEMLSSPMAKHIKGFGKVRKWVENLLAKLEKSNGKEKKKGVKKKGKKKKGKRGRPPGKKKKVVKKKKGKPGRPKKKAVKNKAKKKKGTKKKKGKKGKKAKK